MVDLGVEERRLAVEIIATLVHIKRAMVELLLKPAGVPADVYKPLLSRGDEISGRPLTKRQMAPLLLDAIEQSPDCVGVLRHLIELAGEWKSFHLANDEFAARATVQKARELLGTLETMEAREAKQRELARKAEIARMAQERAEMFRKQSELLLMMFDEMARTENPQQRGYLLEGLLNRAFDLHEIPVVQSFRRNDGAEQIDGAFKLEGWHYLAECKWTSRLPDGKVLDSLKGKVDRSGRQTMGLFVSINGWSEHVIGLLKQNPDKAILLMDGYDLRCVLTNQVDLRDFLLAKGAKLNLEAEPFLGVQQYLRSLPSE